MKTKKLALAALASAAVLATISFSAAPAYAMGCSGSYKDEVAMSCAAGSTWDTETRTCVPTPTG
ncbi:MAG: hypothetical protein AAFY90_03960 [Pseudomonadota bacterium]